MALVNLGCPKNRIDAEIILASLAQAGFEITGDSDDAQAVVVNTCAFIEEAVEESAEVIALYERRRRQGEIERLLVTGCLPQRDPRELVGRFPWVDAFVGIDQIPSVPKLLKDGPGPGHVQVSAAPTWNPGSEYARFVSTPAHYAYLRTAEGCSNLCSYCTIPSIRGGLRLRDPKDIIKEALSLAALGVRELILVAQDTAAHPELPQILAGLEKIEDLRWIRLLYAHPGHLEENLLEQMAASDKILSYIDMPVQHLADPVLERMNRRVSAEKIERLVRKARELDKGFTVRTTVMVGFPGETEDEFKMLMEGLERLRFTHLGIFLYSAEDGTRAAGMGDQIPHEVGKERAERLVRLAERLRSEEIERIKGTTSDALVDFVTDEGALGRLPADAPEIDRILHIKGSGIKPGSFGKVEITGGKDDIIFARWIESYR